MLKLHQLNQWRLGGAVALALLMRPASARSQTSDPLLNTLIKKGIITEQEAREIKAETETNITAVSASKWRLSSAIKEVNLFGDVRFRYEYRGAETVGGLTGDRERLRYAVRLGIRGDLFDDWYYGIRLETAQNSRSPWVTLGGSKSYPYPGPSDKVNDGINVGQIYLGWRAADWLDLSIGRLPNPLYTTALIWDTDINPEGLAEKFKTSVGNVDLFATLGQFVYQAADPNQTISTIPTFSSSDGSTNHNDAFLLAWQVGATVHLDADKSFKIAPTLYTYTGNGQFPDFSGKNSSGYAGTFVGEGGPGGQNLYDPNKPSGQPGYINQSGINDLLVFELPGEFDFKLGRYSARLFGDFAYNLQGADRARAAAQAGGLPQAYTDDVKAYQAGFGIGNLGLVYGTTSKKNTWEARAYWQHTEQYAVDVNLNDSDFFEGRGNLEGVYTALAYSFTDAIIGTFRYGYAQRINKNLGTGGSNQDLPQINPINYYNLVQVDLTWRF